MDESTISGGDIAAAFDAASGASPAPSEPTAAPSGADTTVPPAESGVSDPSVTAGPIPFDRHKAALENARNEWRDKYGWAEGVDRQVIAEAQRVGQLFTQQREQFVDQLLAEGLQDPEMGPKLVSVLARHFGALRQRAQQAPTEDPEPQADRQAEDGTLLYSAAQQAKWAEWRERRLLAQIDQKLQPMQQDREQRMLAEKTAQLQRDADAQADELLTELRTSPGFKDHEKEMKAAMMADPRLTVEAAYRRIVVPKLSQIERSTVLADQHSKVHAGTASPTKATTTAPIDKKDLSWRDAFAHEWEKRTAGVK